MRREKKNGRHEEAVHYGREKLGRVNRGTLGKFASLVVFLIDALNFLCPIPWDGGSILKDKLRYINNSYRSE
jgi:hypothetical protein